MNKAFLLTFCLLFASFTGCVGNSEDNKCVIHNSFSSNDNWNYDWDEYCSDD